MSRRNLLVLSRLFLVGFLLPLCCHLFLFVLRLVFWLVSDFFYHPVKLFFFVVSTSGSLSRFSMRFQSILFLLRFKFISVRFISALWCLGRFYLFQLPLDVLYSPGFTNSFQRSTSCNVCSNGSSASICPMLRMSIIVP